MTHRLAPSRSALIFCAILAGMLPALTAASPARIFGLSHKGRLAPGYDADIVIYDPQGERLIRAAGLHNLAGYTPYEGWRVRGSVRDLFSRGRILVHDGDFAPAPGWGRFIGAVVKNPFETP